VDQGAFQLNNAGYNERSAAISWRAEPIRLSLSTRVTAATGRAPQRPTPLRYAGTIEYLYLRGISTSRRPELSDQRHSKYERARGKDSYRYVHVLRRQCLIAWHIDSGRIWRQPGISSVHTRCFSKLVFPPSGSTASLRHIAAMRITDHRLRSIQITAQYPVTVNVTVDSNNIHTETRSTSPQRWSPTSGHLRSSVTSP